jgi:hypothetical protein
LRGYQVRWIWVDVIKVSNLFLSYPFQPRPTDFYDLRMVYTGY